MAKRLPVLMTVLVAAMGSISWWQATEGFKAFTWESYRRLNVEAEPVSLPNVMLENQDRKLLELSALQGKVLAVNFIYTRCQTVCGYTGHLFAKLQDKITQEKLQAQIQLLSVSLDQDYDRPNRLKGYMQRFTTQDQAWQVVRPAGKWDSEVLLEAMGVVSIPDGMGGIMHNAATHIIDAQGRLNKILDEDEIDDALAYMKGLIRESDAIDS